MKFSLSLLCPNIPWGLRPLFLGKTEVWGVTEWMNEWSEIRLWLLHSPSSQPPHLPRSPGRLGLSHVLTVSVENLQMGGLSLWDSPMANGFPGPARPAGRDDKVCNPGFSMIRLNRSKIVTCVGKGDSRKASLPPPCHHFGQATGMDTPQPGMGCLHFWACSHAHLRWCVRSEELALGASDSALLLLCGLWTGEGGDTKCWKRVLIKHTWQKYWTLTQCLNREESVRHLYSTDT